MVSKKKLPEENSLLENFEFPMQYTDSIPLTLSQEDTKRLLQELKMKEAELELKNEQFQNYIRNLQKSKQQFVDYVSNMSIAFLKLRVMELFIM
ncbi:MAG: hypothetical protein HC830_15500 [Bacteroidetes bacterium]|nr:hypothetical protein [Bacteroidota bacterium]